jgi:energy-coupling factor transport system ATP-binding protein
LDVKLKNLFFSYNPDLSKDDYILKNIDLSVKKGEFVLILGRSGSGKTTLLKIAAGILKPVKGKVYYNDKNILSHSSKKLKGKVGMIFQTPEQQLFERTVYEDVTFVLRRDGKLTKTEIDEIFKKTLKLVGLNYELYKDRLSFSLSSGEKRKAAIACVLINSPNVIILDEPMVGLDHAAKLSLFGIIKRLTEEGKTILCISHDLDMFLDIIDRVYILKGGEIVFSGDKRELLNSYDILKDDVRFAKVFTLLNELRKIDGHVKNEMYSIDDAVSYLRSLVK